VTQLLHPRVTDFLDIVMHRRDLGLWLEEIAVAANAPADGRPLGETKLWGPEGVRVLAIAREGADLVANPRGDLTLSAGDVIIALGTLDQLAVARGEAGDRDHTPATPGRAGRDPRSRSHG
jgi:voltage-gated potassium channel